MKINNIVLYSFIWIIYYFTGEKNTTVFHSIILLLHLTSVFPSGRQSKVLPALQLGGVSAAYAGISKTVMLRSAKGI